MMLFELLSDEDLASRVAQIGAIDPEQALDAIHSEDPALGRKWAISLLESNARHHELQDRVSQHRQNIRKTVA